MESISDCTDFCIAFHLGAGSMKLSSTGKHGLKRYKYYMLKAAKAAYCDPEISIFNDKELHKLDSPVIPVSKCILSLEQSGIVNAGKGSHLNEDGEIETESVIVTSEESTNFSAIGAANCSITQLKEDSTEIEWECTHPGIIANLICLKEQASDPLFSCFLTGEGFNRFLQSNKRYQTIVICFLVYLRD